MWSPVQSVLIAVSVLVFAVAPPVSAKPKPKPIRGVDHIVVVTMENRSFDHLLGWHPTANAMQDGLSYVDDAGFSHPTMELAPDYQGCDHPDPDHSWDGGRIDYNNGAMDGFLFNAAFLQCARTELHDVRQFLLGDSRREHILIVSSCTPHRPIA